jgi:hypothetical protein
VAALQQQLEAAQQAWDKAAKALVEYLPQSKVDSLSAQFTQTQLAYNSQLGKIHSIDLLLSDSRALDGRLTAQQAASAVRSGDALSLLQLHQRASQALVCVELVPSENAQTSSDVMTSSTTDQIINCSVPGSVQFQFSGTGASETAGTVGDAQQDLKVLMASLEKQQADLQSGLAPMESELTLQRSQLESAEFQVDQLTSQRDLAKTTYGALSAQISSAQAEVAANGLVARVVGEAGPAVLVSDKTLLNTLIAAMTAFVVAAICVWVLEWWRSSSEEG